MYRQSPIDTAAVEKPHGGAHASEVPRNNACPACSSGAASKNGPRIALCTPYTGGNLGDMAIQDAVIENLRGLIPNAEFSGITLNSENFLRLHGTAAFPLVGAGAPFFAMEVKWTPPPESPTLSGVFNSRIRGLLRRIPGARKAKLALNWVTKRLKSARDEFRHWVDGYRFLRTQDLLLFSGGGQLDDNYGGAFGLPLTLCKWTLLARLAGLPCAMASIGVGIIDSSTSRVLISIALRMCRYRSFREPRSRKAAGKLFHRVANDLVVPDLALSLPLSEIPRCEESVRTMAGGRQIVVLSPMAFAKPVNWPAPDWRLYVRYIQEIAKVLATLLQQGCFVVVLCSSRGDDESAIGDVLEHLDDEAKASLEQQVLFPKTATWREVLSFLRDADYMIASRLHGTIFGFITETPVVAISFASKVDWVLEYLGQSEYRLDIRTFTAGDVFATLERIRNNRESVVKQLVSVRQKISSESALQNQYELLASFALKHYERH